MRPSAASSSSEERREPDPEGEVLSAPHIIEYPFKRTTGPVIGAFLTGLREQVAGAASRAPTAGSSCRRVEYDPDTAEELTELVEVGPTGRGHRPGRGSREPHAEAPARPAVRLGPDQARRRRHRPAARRRRRSTDAVSHRHAGRAALGASEREGQHHRHRPASSPRRPRARRCMPDDRAPGQPARRRAGPQRPHPGAARLRVHRRRRPPPGSCAASSEKKILGERCPVVRQGLRAAPRRLPDRRRAHRRSRSSWPTRHRHLVLRGQRASSTARSWRCPTSSALILLDGADISLMHLIQEVAGRRGAHRACGSRRCGCPTTSSAPTLESIKYFRPTGEPRRRPDETWQRLASVTCTPDA